MKKWATILLAARWIIVISEAFLRPVARKANSNEFFILVKNNCKEEINGLRYRYSLGETPAGGGTVHSANGKTETGHFLKISFTEEDFEAEAILSDFSIEFYLLAENGEEIFAGKKTFAASFAEGYQMGVSGDRKTGYKISWIKD